MKKSYRLGSLAISLLGLIFLIFGNSSGVVQAQTEETVSPTETETPSPTPEPPNLTVVKDYQFTDDQNHNGSIDPGERITYSIRVVNNNTTTTDLVLRDEVNWDYFDKSLEDNSPNCIINFDFIECTLEQAGTAEVHYTVRIKDSLDFKGNDALAVDNRVTVFYEATPMATANVEFGVNAPTLTPTATATITPTPTITTTPTITQIPTASPTPAPPPATPLPPGAASLEKTPVSIVTVGLLALLGIGVFTYIGGIAKFQSSDDPKINHEITVARVSMFREGIIIIFIVSAVLLMGISGTLTSDGVISILSAIVGYVFGRASNRI